MQETSTYQERSWDFLSKAREEWDAGDLAQASEKGWGAAAMMVKAAAEQQGVVHERHFHLFNIVNDLESQTGDRELRRLFAVANGLHGNFYENLYTAQAVQRGIDDVEEFVAKMDQILKA